MNYTKNLKLRKPEGGEYYSIDDFNNNVDVLDAALIEKADKPTNFMLGNLTAIGAGGNLEDSGRKPADFAGTEHGHDTSYAPISHVSDMTVHVNTDEKAAIATVSGKADRTYVDSALSTKANLKSPAFEETATLNGKKISTFESGTWIPELKSYNYGLPVTCPSVTYTIRDGRWVKTGNILYVSCNLHGTITSVGTGIATVFGLPFIPKSLASGATIVEGISAITPTLAVVISGVSGCMAYLNNARGIVPDKLGDFYIQFSLIMEV